MEKLPLLVLHRRQLGCSGLSFKLSLIITQHDARVHLHLRGNRPIHASSQYS
jgi:hypothetical protein